MSKILTSPSSFGQINNEPFNMLKKNDFEVINNPYGRKLTEDEVIELAEGCIGIVAGVEPITARVMDSLPDLKCISRVGVGMDSVDLEYAKSKGIVVVNTPNGPTRAVAEFSLSLTLSLLRKIPQANADLKNKIWKKQTGNLLFEKQIGIIGLGRIGRMVAELYRSLGNPVIGYDLYPDKKWAKEKGVELKSFDEVVASSDILILHLSGNFQNEAIIGCDEINKMKTTAFLINLARGGAVDEEALCDSLKNNRLAGAAVDVFMEEPYSGPLCDLENVILTPHIGSYASEGKLNMEIEAVNNLINILF
jgi:D-3-phosphoglycerate dehydrogenase